MIKTEMRNEKTKNIDKMSTTDMLKVMQEENINAAKSIESEISSIAVAVDEISKRMKKGGRLFYVGCGTSGRLGIIDAAECPPTFGVSPTLVNGIIAGGNECMVKASENAEDSYENGFEKIEECGITSNDSVVGISVAGGARYVLGAIDAAKSKGAVTIALTSNAGSPVDDLADIKIHPDTGAEVITGSTRLKAGSAHKMILNMISTGVMVKLGYVYENLMVNLKPSNIKLKDRMIRIVVEITGKSYNESLKLLEENDFSIKKAVSRYSN